MTHSLLQAVWQSMAILVLASILGLGVNSVRHDPLPLLASGPVGVQSTSPTGGDHPLITLEEAEALYFDQGALFLDARPREDYRKGHIEGAKNLPWDDFDRRFHQVMPDIPYDAIIIAYCDGESCSLSRELASALFARGYDRVRVLVDGWGLWQQRNLPTE